MHIYKTIKYLYVTYIPGESLHPSVASSLITITDSFEFSPIKSLSISNFQDHLQLQAKVDHLLKKYAKTLKRERER